MHLQNNDALAKVKNKRTKQRKKKKNKINELFRFRVSIPDLASVCPVETNGAASETKVWGRWARAASWKSFFLTRLLQ